MFHQKDQLRRDLLDNPRIYQDVLANVHESLADTIKVSGKSNAIYTAAHFNRCMIHASMYNGQVAGCANSAKSLDIYRRPSEEWMRDVADKTQADDVYEYLARTISEQLDMLYRFEILKRHDVLDVAVDMHLIPRYDKKYGRELVRSKFKSGTCIFERYITIQCIVAGHRLVLGVLAMPALEDLADFVRKIIDSARNAGASLGIVMMDREFFSSEVIKTLDVMGISYLMPCRNTSAVVDAIDEFEKKRRDTRSSCVITGTGQPVPYNMIIAKRKKKKDALLPHDRFIGFATNVADINVEEYGRRWGIETGYRIIENARIRTHSKNPTTRLLYFVYSVCIFNAWVMANAMLAFMTGIHQKDPMITQQAMNDMLMLSYVFDYRMPPEPPPSTPS